MRDAPIAKIAQVRIGRIRLKSGGEVRLLPDEGANRKVAYFNMIAASLNSFSRPLAGFAFVAWDVRGYTEVQCCVDATSKVQTVLVPEYARALIAEHILEYRIATPA